MINTRRRLSAADQPWGSKTLVRRWPLYLPPRRGNGPGYRPYIDLQKDGAVNITSLLLDGVEPSNSDEVRRQLPDLRKYENGRNQHRDHFPRSEPVKKERWRPRDPADFGARYIGRSGSLGFLFIGNYLRYVQV